MSAKDPRQQMLNLSEALVEDLMRVSDEELLDEVRQDGQDPDVLSAQAAKVISDAATRHGKTMLARAREAFGRALERRPTVTGSQTRSLVEKRQIIDRFAARDAEFKNKLTLAARSGHELTESDVDSMLQDLRDLGAIDEEGKEP